MRAIKKARKLIESQPNSETAQALTALILSLESNTDFSMHNLYDRNHEDFELMIDVIKDWRLDRYYEGKVKAIDTALQAKLIEGTAT